MNKFSIGDKVKHTPTGYKGTIVRYGPPIKIINYWVKFDNEGEYAGFELLISEILLELVLNETNTNPDWEDLWNNN